MSFLSREKSRSKGAPIDLYLFRYGDGALDYYAFTNAEKTVTFNNVDYRPMTITRDSITTSGSLDNTDLPIRVPYNNEVAELFRVYPPGKPVNCIVYTGHAGDNEFIAIWNGRILGVKWEGYEAVLSGEMITSQRRRPGLRRNYQYACPHVLYGTGVGKCNANKGAATIKRTVVDYDGNTLQLIYGWYQSELKHRFVNGVVEWINVSGQRESRTILRIQGEQHLVLSGPMKDVIPGTEVSVVLGCDHSEEFCETVHDNIVNFGGCPWIPTMNPLGQVNNFY